MQLHHIKPKVMQRSYWPRLHFCQTALCKEELDLNSKYFKLRLPYQLGVGKIYDRKKIELRKNDIEFKREFELQYLSRICNVFTPQ